MTGDLTAIEVVPDGDIREHCSSEDCDCIPTIKSYSDGIWMLIHNAFDGREFGEKGNIERGH
jgi:hypothetical protein